MESDYIFVDSSMWKALVDPKDDFSKVAVQIWHLLEQKNVRLLSTNYILDEVFTLIRKRCGLETVNLLRDRLASEYSRVKIIRITISDEAKAWDWFLKSWSDLSFTDCTSFSVMDRLGIEAVATFDKHFQKAGFKIVDH